MSDAPIIVSALFGPADFGWLDGLRKAHFPPERNQLPAHLTLFHHLDPSVEAELAHRLAVLTAVPPPAATADCLLKLGRGVAIRIRSPELAAIRYELAGAFSPILTSQDMAPWRPHVTIQNKVRPADAERLYRELEPDFQPRSVQIAGLAAWRYRGGPWELICRHPFCAASAAEWL